jgi:hypothetical protein
MNPTTTTAPTPATDSGCYRPDPLPAIGEKINVVHDAFIGGWILRDAKPHNPESPTDGLTVVLVSCSRRDGLTGWATWIHNAETGALTDGNHSMTPEKAREDFTARGIVGGAA